MRSSSLVFGTLLAIAIALPSSRPARACGGFFCNASVPTIVVQAGERVLFARTDDGVTMHIEVQYAGDPTQFAWLLPLAERPTDREGRPLPLERAVQVSVSELFQTLQPLTDPTFNIAQGDSLGDECDRSSFGCGGDDAGGKALASDSDGVNDGTESPPSVVLTDEARVGPYDAQLIEATDADDLFDWLGDNGYQQDPAARPLLEHYVKEGFVFVGLRLQNGMGSGDIRPIALSLGETAPCVPLRLTRIAATDDMPILVWVLGPARAVPKNFVHAVVNDRAITFPGGQNYLDVVSEAVDLASGHAWVTEASEPTNRFRGRFLSAGGFSRQRLDTAATLAQVIDAFGPSLRTSPSAMQVWREELSPPPTADDDLDDPRFTLVNDVPTLRARLYAELIDPLQGIEDLFADTATLTRFFTTSDAAEMTKDPIFAFNPDLPEVSPAHTITVSVGTNDDCDQIGRVTYADGSHRNLSPGETFQPMPAQANASPLLFAEVLDEEGPPLRFDPLQAIDVDRVLDDALPGIPSLPSTFTLDPPPSHSNDDDDGGCSLGLPGAHLFLPLLFLSWRRSRRQSSPNRQAPKMRAPRNSERAVRAARTTRTA